MEAFPGVIYMRKQQGGSGAPQSASVEPQRAFSVTALSVSLSAPLFTVRSTQPALPLGKLHLPASEAEKTGLR